MKSSLYGAHMEGDAVARCVEKIECSRLKIFDWNSDL